MANPLDPLGLFSSSEPTNSPGVASDVRRTFGQLAGGTGRTLRDLGAEDVGGALEQYGEGVVRRNPSQINSLDDILSRPGTAVRESLGEAAGQFGQGLATGIGGRLIGGALGSIFGPLGTALGATAGGYIGSLVPVALQTYGGIRQEQDREGVDDIGRALMATGPAVALERLFGAERLAGGIASRGLGNVLRDVPQDIASMGLGRYVGRQAVRGFVGEGLATEVPQTALERYGAFKDLTGPEALDEYAVAGFKGGIGGAGVNTAIAPFERSRAISDVAATDLMRRTAEEAERRAVEPQQRTAVPLVDRINEQFGLAQGTSDPTAKEREAQQRAYSRQFLDAFNEPSGVRVVDPATGVERELSIGEYRQLQAGLLDPNANTLDLGQGNRPMLPWEPTKSDMGTMAVSPNGFVDNPSGPLDARFGPQPLFPWVDTLRDAQRPGEGLSALDLINRETGVEREGGLTKRQFNTSFNEPSGTFVQDPETGIERELTRGELAQLQAGVNNPNTLDLGQGQRPMLPAPTTNVTTDGLAARTEPDTFTARFAPRVVPTPAPGDTAVAPTGQAGVSTSLATPATDIRKQAEDAYAEAFAQVDPSSKPLTDKQKKDSIDKLFQSRQFRSVDELLAAVDARIEAARALPGMNAKFLKRIETFRDVLAQSRTANVPAPDPTVDMPAAAATPPSTLTRNTGKKQITLSKKEAENTSPVTTLTPEQYAAQNAPKAEAPVAAEMATENPFDAGLDDDAPARRQKILDHAFGKSRGMIFGLLMGGGSRKPVDIRNAVNSELAEGEKVTIADVEAAVGQLRSAEGRKSFQEEVEFAAEDLGYQPEQRDEAFSDNVGSRATPQDRMRRDFFTRVFGEDDVQIFELYSQGMSQKDIETETGLSQQRVSERLAQLTPKSKKATEDLLDRVGDAQRAMSLTPSQVRSLLTPPEAREVDQPGEEINERDATPDLEERIVLDRSEFVPGEDADQQSGGEIGSAGGTQSNIDARGDESRTISKLITLEAQLAEAEARVKASKAGPFAKENVAATALINRLAQQIAQMESAFGEKYSTSEAVDRAREQLDKNRAEAEEAARRSRPQRSNANPDSLFDNVEEVDLDADTQAELAAERTEQTQDGTDRVGATLTGANDKPAPKSRAVTVVKKGRRAQAAPKVEAKPDPLRDVAGETTQDRAKRLWTEQRRDGYPEWADLSDKAQNAVVALVKEGPKRADQSDIDAVATQVARNVNGMGVVRTGTASLSRNAQQAPKDDGKTIDDDGTLIRERVERAMLTGPVNRLPPDQLATLEREYKVDADDPTFFDRLKEDIVNYLTKGAEAVSARIRHIIKDLAAVVLAVAVAFNPSFISQPQATVVHSSAQFEQQANTPAATIPAEAESKMSDAAKEAYRTLYPALKGQLQAANKLLVIADKPNARVFLFNPDGSLLLERKTLYGAAVGDYLKGSNTLPQNRITPAGLFDLGLRDATRSAGERRTAGDYDFGKVFVLDKAGDGYSVTVMHSVYLKEKDAMQRKAALQSDRADDARYSFGCINVDRDTFGFLVKNHLDQMDGAKLFVVPDDQSAVKDFLSGETQDDGLRRQKVAPPLSSAGDNPLTGEATETVTLDELAGRSEGVVRMRDNFARYGLTPLFDFVNKWVIGDAGGDNGTLTQTPRGPTLELNRSLLESDEHEYVSWVASHEVGHAIDIDARTGEPTYSNAPEFGLIVNPRTNEVVPVGSIAKEMHALYSAGGPWTGMLEYPFDLGKHSQANRLVVRAELFAQLWAAYTNPRARDLLRTDAPVAFDFMERVATHATQRAGSRRRVQTRRGATADQDGGAQVVQAGKPATATGRLASQGTAEKVNDLLSSRASPASRSRLTTVTDLAKRFGLTAMITEDIADLARKYLPSVDRYVEASKKIVVERTRGLQEIDRITEMYDRLAPHERANGEQSVNKMLRDMTLSGKWAFKPDWADGVEADRALEARFNVMTPTAQSVVKAVFKRGHDMQAKKRDALLREIDQQAEDDLAATSNAKERKAIERRRDLSRELVTERMRWNPKAPYAPLKRYGEYVMVAKSQAYLDADRVFKETGNRRELERLESDERHYVVTFHESLGEAERARNELGDTYAYKQAFQKDAGRETLYGSTDLFLSFGRLKNMLKEQFGEASAERNRGLRRAADMINDLYILTLAETSARKSELERRKVAGADADMMRAFVTQGRADAHFLAQMNHGTEVIDRLEDMRREAKESGERAEATRYANEFTLRHAQGMDYKVNRLVDGLKRTSSIWLLATSPAYYFQQLVQPFVLSLPMMGGQFGLGRSAKALTDAYGLIRPLMQNTGVVGKLDTSKLAPQHREVIEAMIDMGRIDMGMDDDLGRFDSDNTAINRGDTFLRGANNKVEQINRAATALAAYNLYISAPGNAGKKQEALKYAGRIIHQTHGSYDGFNSPRVMGGVSSWAGLFLQFKKFQIIQLSLLARLFNDAFRNAKPEERAVARKQLAFVTGNAFMLGGALGLPGANVMLALVNAIFGDEDEPDDPELLLRRAIGDKGMADLLLKGVPAAGGVDLSGRLGMGNALSLLPYTDVDLTSRTGMEKVLIGLAGPFIGGLVPKAADGVGLMLKGEYVQGAEKLLPNGIGNAIKGTREGTTGVVDRAGTVLVKPEDIDLVEMGFQMVGLPPTQVTERFRVRDQLKGFEKFYADRSTEIRADYVRAYRANDAAGMTEAREAWQRIQESRRRNGFTTQPMSALMRAPQQASERERNVVDGVATNRFNRRFVEEVAQ